MFKTIADDAGSTGAFTIWDSTYLAVLSVTTPTGFNPLPPNGGPRTVRAWN